MSRPKLFCFTYAGGAAYFFNVIEPDLKGIDLIKLEYAGHGDRHNEPFYESCEMLADDMFSRLNEYDIENYALLGYSMGSISAVETLRRIIAAGMSLPAHIFLCAHEPQTKSELLGFSADELDEWVMQRTLRFGDVPERLINNRVFWRTYLPIYRADYTIIGKYAFDQLDLRTSIPATIFYSEDDTPLSGMRQWEKYFTGDVYYERYKGNHFFIREHHGQMADVIKKRLGVIV